MKYTLTLACIGLTACLMFSQSTQPSVQERPLVPSQQSSSTAAAEEIRRAQAGIMNGRLYKESSRPEFFLIRNGKKQWIPSPDVMRNLGFDYNDVSVMPDGALSGIERLPDLSGPVLDALQIPFDTGTKPSRVFFEDGTEEMRRYCPAPGFLEAWCKVNFNPVGSSKDPRSVVAHDVFVAGWIESHNPNCFGGGTNPLCDEDYHYELRLDPDFINEMYGPGGLISSLARATLPGNPSVVARKLPFQATDEYGRPAGITLNSFVLPAPRDADKPVNSPAEILSRLTAQLHVELQPWHVINTAELWSRNWIGKAAAPPSGWIRYEFAEEPERGYSDLTKKRARMAQSWWPFEPGQLNGTGIVPMQYVVMRGSIWQDAAHGDSEEQAANQPWEHGTTRGHGGWLEMHPPDFIRASKPYPECVAANGDCRKKMAYSVSDISSTSKFATFTLTADLTDDHGNPIGFVRPGYTLRFQELVDGRFTEAGSYDREAAVTGPGVVNIRLRLYGTPTQPARYKAAYILWWEPNSTPPPPAPPPPPPPPTRRTGTFGTSDRADVINYLVEPNVAANDIVEFRICNGNGLTWQKTMNMPDGHGSSWNLTVRDGTRCTTNSLWAGQVNNGQSLTLYKAKFLGIMTEVHTVPISHFFPLPPGSRLTLTWVRD